MQQHLALQIWDTIRAVSCEIELVVGQQSRTMGRCCWLEDAVAWISCLCCHCDSHADVLFATSENLNVVMTIRRFQRGHAIASVLAAIVPVAVSLVVCQAPSLLQSHHVEELALILWGGWSIGTLGGVMSAYQTHLSWKYRPMRLVIANVNSI